MDIKSLLHLRFNLPPQKLTEPIATPPFGEFLQSLAETVLWCAHQSITAVSPETPDTLYRRGLIQEANILQRGLSDLLWERWKQDPDWNRARALYEEADTSSLDLLRNQLRSPALKPLAAQSASLQALRMYFQEGVQHVTLSRAGAIAELGLEGDAVFDGGRLLHYFPMENLCDGASRYASNGFFDDDNVPPWDTWCSYDNDTLTSWVPEILVPLAQLGIDANPEQCICWA